MKVNNVTNVYRLISMREYPTSTSTETEIIHDRAYFDELKARRRKIFLEKRDNEKWYITTIKVYK